MKQLFWGALFIVVTAGILADEAPAGVVTEAGREQGAATRRADTAPIPFEDGLPRVSRMQIAPLSGKCIETVCASFQYCPLEGTNCMVGASTQGCQIAEGPRDANGACACANC